MIKVAFLRALNVGKTNRIKMNELKSLFIDIGFSNIRCYLQSGNILFETNMNSNVDLEEKIEKFIQKRFLLEIKVLVRDPDQLFNIISKSMYCKKYLFDNLYVTFLKYALINNEIDKLIKLNSENDRVEILGNDLIIFCKDKYHKSKLNNSIIENKLKTVATSRKLNTINKLLEMLE